MRDLGLNQLVESGALRRREDRVDRQCQQGHGFGALRTHRFGYSPLQRKAAQRGLCARDCLSVYGRARHPQLEV